jgi:hypothetical protein
MKRHIIRFNERWALAADNLQWILKHYRPPKWHGVAYIASNKVVLRRVLREKGVTLTPDAKDALDHLPDTFPEWRNKQDARSSETEERSSDEIKLSASDHPVRSGGRE